ncbi:hypothetical protein ACFL0W_05135 [Nanoarchaeota archaeon]
MTAISEQIVKWGAILALIVILMIVIGGKIIGESNPVKILDVFWTEEFGSEAQKKILNFKEGYEKAIKGVDVKDISELTKLKDGFTSKIDLFINDLKKDPQKNEAEIEELEEYKKKFLLDLLFKELNELPDETAEDCKKRDKAIEKISGSEPDQGSLINAFSIGSRCWIDSVANDPDGVTAAERTVAKKKAKGFLTKERKNGGDKDSIDNMLERLDCHPDDYEDDCDLKGFCFLLSEGLDRCEPCDKYQSCNLYYLYSRIGNKEEVLDKWCTQDPCNVPKNPGSKCELGRETIKGDSVLTCKEESIGG